MKRLYLWSHDLRAAVKDAEAARPVNISPWLFCNREGVGYINEKTGRAGGWESLWRNFMDRVMTETKVTVPFNEHDIRAKVASDAESLGTPAHCWRTLTARPPSASIDARLSG
ncbi:integrase [Pandoraea terrae]|uniref:Integrase n=1 Tax=Pandoraea terrae TaxID=1537710 RepID=A0A5E4VD64_9BURK|nr:hypothetical protein [Pandoraea terrae]VVE10162.1 integrase [Pandoraea terrae]